MPNYQASLPAQEATATMATIRASCNECGDVELTTADVRVRVCLDTGDGEYSFRCPICAMTIVKSAENRTIDLLVASGVSMETWKLPAELNERRVGAPITHDDILDFHQVLENEESLWATLESLS